ncbi:periplasmic heavy metal sensor [Rhodobacterales bacterium HKCCE2091]|nr:periplasmic heavy metal sensor [Rhodobacterales bacterium HKCCE2091]
MAMKAPFLALSLVAVATAAAGQTAQPYAGQERRPIAALSDDEVQGLLEGRGLGYALSAELNGWPGPLHVLELADDLALTAEQRDRVEAIRQDMLSTVRPIGAELVEAETALDDLFAGGAPEADAILAAAERVGAIEARLRAAHLAAHVETTPVLTPHQRMIYGRARGYGAAHEPAAHDHD